LAIDDDASSIIFLTTLLGVEVCFVENESDLLTFRNIACVFVEFLSVIDGLDLAVDVVSPELGAVVRFCHARHLLQFAQIVDVQLKQPGFLELVVIDGKASFFGHKSCQINRESKGVVQSPDISTVQLLETLGLAFLSIDLELPLSPIQRLRKGKLFFVEDLLDLFFLCHDFLEHVSHLCNQSRHDPGEKVPNLDVEVFSGIPRSTP
ncbi:alanyl-tRNA synthetase, partial [Aureobasidium melanogenum]